MEFIVEVNYYNISITINEIFIVKTLTLIKTQIITTYT